MGKTKKEKYYVVWRGLNPGIYRTWEECQKQVKGVATAAFMSFPTQEEAEEAFYSDPSVYIGKRKAKPDAKAATPKPASVSAASAQPQGAVGEAIAVDAACSGNPGKMEYRGVHLPSGKQLFHFGPVWGTNNIGEFLAIVHALALMKQRGMNLTVYSDSRNAQLWIRKKHCRTTLQRTPRTKEVYDLIDRAERWLASNDTSGATILKWQTKLWGEIPADFGRKK